ncbi:MAG: type II CAAX endopeptidase family protein [Pseudomonadota bacterium]
MNFSSRKVPPLKLVLVIFVLVALLQFFSGYLIVSISPVLGILVNETIVMLTLPIAIIILAGFTPFPLLKMQRPDRKQMIVAVCVILGLAVFLTYLKAASNELVPIPKVFIERHTQAIAIYSWHDFFLKLALLGLLAPVCEEIFFRGILQGSLEKRIGSGRAIIVTAILFSLIHSTSFHPHLLLILGLMLSWLYSITGTLRVPILCHAISNCWVLVNQIRGVRIPLTSPPGSQDVLLAGSAAIMVVAGITWLYLRSKKPCT